MLSVSLLVDAPFAPNLHSTAMADLFFETALVSGAWARDVRIGVDEGGSIASVAVDALPDGAERTTGIAVPGVPNLHSHAFQRALAGLTERGASGGDSFWTWRQRMYRFLSVLDPDDVQAIAAQLFVELLRHGFTAVAEFHYLRNRPDGAPHDDPVEMARRVLHAAAATGMGVTVLPVLYRTAGFGGMPASDEQRRFVTTVDDVLGDVTRLAGATDGTRTCAGLALHSLRAVPPTDLAAALDAFAHVLPGSPVHVHVAEQEREVEECLRWSGARPVEWLLANAPVDGRWCLVHATHVVEHEIAAMATSRAVVGLCPTTEANLGDGTFPLADYLRVGGVLGVGTDSHVSVSPVAELRALEYGQRLRHRARNVAAGDTNASTGRVLLDAAYRGGATACGRPLGDLATGHRADIVVLDPDHPALVGRDGDDVVDAWLFSGEDTPVSDVMVGGRWVVRDGHHVRQEDVLGAYRRVAERLRGA